MCQIFWLTEMTIGQVVLAWIFTISNFFLIAVENKYKAGMKHDICGKKNPFFNKGSFNGYTEMLSAKYQRVDREKYECDFSLVLLL